MSYTKQNWHQKWTDAKKKAKLKDSRLQAITVQLLNDIETKGVFPMASERNAKHHLLGLDRDDL